MNKWIGIGRLVADPEVKYSQGENASAVARYRIAVERRFKREGDQTADFISCVAFGKAGEFAEKYLRKGTKIAVTGRIQTGSYTNQDGQKVYTTDVIVEEHEFCESKGSGTGPAAPQVDENGFMNIPDGIDEELPSNNFFWFHSRIWCDRKKETWLGKNTVEINTEARKLKLMALSLIPRRKRKGFRSCPCLKKQGQFKTCKGK